MKNKYFKSVTVSIIALLLCFCAIACGEKNDSREAASKLVNVTAEATENTITVTVSDSGDYEAEYSLDGSTWQSSNIFTGLNANTEYTVYARKKESSAYLSSESTSRTVKTKKQSQNAPEAAGFTQENKTIQFASDEDGKLEYSYDSGSTYVSEKSYTFSENGEKQILIRYKEQGNYYASETVSVSVYISDYFSGSGTQESPFIIKTYAHLTAIKSSLAFSSLQNSRVYYRLEDDITFPANTVLTNPIPAANATIDGNYKTILNAGISTQNLSDTGLFAGPVTISNLTVKKSTVNVRVTQDSNAVMDIGILASSAEVIKNCVIDGGSIKISSMCALSKSVYIGAVAGELSYNSGAKALDCTVLDVSINYDEQRINTFIAGGLFGRVNGFSVSQGQDNPNQIVRCYAEDVSIEMTSANLTVGGLIGIVSYATVEDSFAAGTISANVKGSDYKNYLGGLIGSMRGTISNCYAAVDITATVSGHSLEAGGIAGSSSELITNCFYTGRLDAQIADSGSTLTAKVGAINGYSGDNTLMTNCYFGGNSVFVETDSRTQVADSEQSVEVTDDQLHYDTWQKTTLNWSEEVWQFENTKLPNLIRT